jgi:hypothetical protein
LCDVFAVQESSSVAAAPAKAIIKLTNIFSFNYIYFSIRKIGSVKGGRKL